MAGCKWPISIGPLRSLLIAGQNLVCVGRPGNREQRQNRNNGQCFHGRTVTFDCGQKRQSLAHFRDQRVKNRGRWLLKRSNREHYPSAVVKKTASLRRPPIGLVALVNDDLTVGIVVTLPSPQAARPKRAPRTLPRVDIPFFSFFLSPDSI